MESPIISGQLQKFLCAMLWIRSEILNFRALVSDLDEIMECIKAYTERPTKRAALPISLTHIGWTSGHTTAFENYKKMIADRTPPARRDESTGLYIYTNVSDACWSGIVIHMRSGDVSLPHSDQAREPFAFYSRRFNEPERIGQLLKKKRMQPGPSCTVHTRLPQISMALIRSQTTITFSLLFLSTSRQALHKPSGNTNGSTVGRPSVFL